MKNPVDAPEAEAVGSQVECPVGRLEPERARPCSQGCNGCDYCTDYEDDDDPWNQPAATCRHCSGTGGDPWNGGITPCEHCDGEGYEWWK
jgi:hypothetical protein